MSSSGQLSMVDLSWALQTWICPVASSLRPGAPFTIDVIVRNNLDHPLTVLTWDSPLDQKAGILGIFQARDVEEDELIQGDFLRFRRKMPPPKDSFREIGGKEQITQRITLPGLRLSTGTEFIIEGRGRWQAVWNCPMADVDESLLVSLADAHCGDVFCVSDSFEINDESSSTE